MAIELSEQQARNIINHSLMFCIDVERSLEFFYPTSKSDVFTSTETMIELVRTTPLSLKEIKHSFQRGVH